MEDKKDDNVEKKTDLVNQNNENNQLRHSNMINLKKKCKQLGI